MDPRDRAAAEFAGPFNCAQAVLVAHAEPHGLDRGLALRLASPFGAGLGHTGDVCGVVTGALLVIGLVHGQRDGEPSEAKQRGYERAQAFLERFEARAGGRRCQTLLGEDLATDEGLARAHAQGLFETRCAGLVRLGVEVLDEIL